jgi:hypothetical protein
MPGGLVFAQYTHRQAYGTSGAVALPSMGTRKAASHESDRTCRGGTAAAAPTEMERYSMVSARLMRSTCSCALRFVDPVAGEADAGREATLTSRFLRFRNNSMQMNGQAP